MILKSDAEQNESSPLLGPYLRTARSHLGGTETSIANFYSPIESAHASDSEDDQVKLKQMNGEGNILKTYCFFFYFFQFEEFRGVGIENVKNAYELLGATDWKIERTNEVTGDCIQSLQRKNIGKIFRLTVGAQFKFNFNGNEFYTKSKLITFIRHKCIFRRSNCC